MTALPIARPVARATSSASGEESMPGDDLDAGASPARGLKKCMPTTRPGSAAAPAIAVIGIDEVFEARTAPGAICAQRGEQLALELEALGRRLDDQAAAGQPAELRRPPATVARLALEAALRPPALEAVGDLGQAALARLVDGVVQQRAGARRGGELRDPGAHGPGADDADRLGHCAHAQDASD